MPGHILTFYTNSQVRVQRTSHLQRSKMLNSLQELAFSVKRMRMNGSQWNEKPSATTTLLVNIHFT